MERQNPIWLSSICIHTFTNTICILYGQDREGFTKIKKERKENVRHNGQKKPKENVYSDRQFINQLNKTHHVRDNV